MSTVITLASTIVAKSYIGKVEYFFSQKLDLSGDALSSTKDASNFFIFFLWLGSFLQILISTCNESIIATACRQIPTAKHSTLRRAAGKDLSENTRCDTLQKSCSSLTTSLRSNKCRGGEDKMLQPPVRIHIIYRQSMNQVKTRFVWAYSVLWFVSRDMQ